MLDIPVSFIHVMETSSATVPNASPSASSLCTELYGMAVVVSNWTRKAGPKKPLYVVVLLLVVINSLRVQKSLRLS